MGNATGDAPVLLVALLALLVVGGVLCYRLTKKS
jgi:hypothetical protein